MEKKGQFYIIAALLIVLAVSGIVSLSIYAVARPRPAIVDDFSQTVSQEYPYVIDHGISHREDIPLLLENFTDEIIAPQFLYKTRNVGSISFVYGNATDLFHVKYDTSETGNIGIVTGEEKIGLPILSTVALREHISVTPQDEFVSVVAYDHNLSFPLHDNELFYFVIIYGEDEQYVATNA